MEIYIVKRGDTLEDISNLYNIPRAEIIRINNLSAPYTLIEGQTLNIPTGMFNIFNYYTVKQNDTLYQIAQKNNIDIDTLAAINGLENKDYIYTNQMLLIPKPNLSVYITKETDTMASVADHFKTSQESITYSNKNIYLLPEQLIVYRKI